MFALLHFGIKLRRLSGVTLQIFHWKTIQLCSGGTKVLFTGIRLLTVSQNILDGAQNLLALHL